jgi:CRP/FNR family transcriptional regulator, cyclic AMP receptor protein
MATSMTSAQLIAELEEQVLIAHDTPTAKFLAEKGKLLELTDGAVLTEQGKVEDQVHFIVDGKVDVFVSHHHVGVRKAREHVGEMIAIHPASTRSATVKAIGRVVVLAVSVSDFQAALDKNPIMWKPLAKVVAERLREREKLLRPKNLKPVMFIGSSAEGIGVAKLVIAGFEHDKHKLEIVPWFHDVFGPSHYPVDDLLAQVKRADFALFVFGPDDKVASRGTTTDAPRDNVVFELGLFMGGLARERVVMLQHRGTDLKIPSDLTGLGPLTYTKGGGVPTATDLITPCETLRKLISERGVI